jgi:hypothetical protein
MIRKNHKLTLKPEFSDDVEQVCRVRTKASRQEGASVVTQEGRPVWLAQRTEDTGRGTKMRSDGEAVESTDLANLSFVFSKQQ